MPGFAACPPDERGTLIAQLEQQHCVAHHVSYGLTDDQIALSPCRSALSIGGLLRHLTTMEEVWMVRVAAAPDLVDLSERSGAWENEFVVPEGATLASILQAYDATLARSVDVIRTAPDLGAAVPLPPAPWFDGQAPWTVRGVVNHVLTETAHHLGHADIIREEVDGATWYELMAAAEKWPETDWLKPWRRASA